MPGLGDVLTIVGSVFGIRAGTEEPDFTLVAELASNITIRLYPELVAVETDLPGATPEEFRNQAFRRLFRYISGANRDKTQIAMTAPVEQSGREVAMTAPVETSQADGAQRMRFFLPANFTLASAPEPADPTVRIVSVPARLLAVNRFAGFANEAALAEARADLLAALMTSRFLATGDPFAMLYDPPFTLPFMRRNEMAVEVQQQGSA